MFRKARKTGLSSLSTTQMFGLWWQKRWVRGLVIGLMPVGFIDAITTVWLWQLHGYELESNPVVRTALSTGLWAVWFLMDIISFPLFAMFVGSYYLHTRESDGQWLRVLSALVALRIAGITYNIAMLFQHPESSVFSAVSWVVAYIMINSLLSRKRDVSVEGLKRFWKSKLDALRIYWLVRGIRYEKSGSPKEANEVEAKIMQEKDDENITGLSAKKVWLKRAGWIAGAFLVLIFIPAVLAGIGFLTGGIYWTEIFGGQFFWNQLSGITFVLGFFVTIALFGVIMLFLMNVFEETEGAW